MLEALMLPPCIIVVMSSEAEGLGHVDVKNIKLIASLFHLREETTLRISDAKHAMLDFHTRPILI